MAKAEASVEELVGMIERGELRLPEMQRQYVWRSTKSVFDILKNGLSEFWNPDDQIYDNFGELIIDYYGAGWSEYDLRRYSKHIAAIDESVDKVRGLEDLMQNEKELAEDEWNNFFNDWDEDLSAEIEYSPKDNLNEYIELKNKKFCRFKISWSLVNDDNQGDDEFNAAWLDWISSEDGDSYLDSIYCAIKKETSNRSKFIEFIFYDVGDSWKVSSNFLKSTVSVGPTLFADILLLDGYKSNIEVVSNRKFKLNIFIEI